jgi:deoxyribodipyrimidine photo-lyase
MTPPLTIVWFRRDLRIADNPALSAACARGGPVIALYIHEEQSFFSPGGAQKWFLHQALISLEASLRRLGVDLVLRKGAAPEEIESVIRESGAGGVFWNRRYAAAEIETDQAIMAALKKSGVETRSFNGSLLCEPWEIETKTGGPYRVFTPFWKALRASGPSRTEIGAAKAPPTQSSIKVKTDRIDDWGFLPSAPNWAKEFAVSWKPGEVGAANNLKAFLSGAINNYDEDRNRPAIKGTSRLSPDLAVGTISPLRIWNATHRAIAAQETPEGEATKFLSEIAWREFAYHLLYHNPSMPTEPIKPAFRNFPWRDDQKQFDAWTRGETGVPIVDAGMRELWRTGWMHNRVRMIVASFLVKNLLLPWQWGERWFWDTLVDADPANNTASWQWVAGCGADAAPYFRIFNPVTQGEKFDSDGAYVRTFVPEIAALPNTAIHAPWKAAASTPEGYPPPLVELDQTRKRALAAYETMKSAGAPLEIDDPVPYIRDVP